MGRARLFLVASVSLALLLLPACSERGVNPFDPAQDREPPVVTSFTVVDGRAVWTTDEPALCVLEYGPAGQARDRYVYEATKTHATAHEATFLGMEDGVSYELRVRSRDRAGNEAYGSDVPMPVTVAGAAFTGERMTLAMINVGWGLSMALTTPGGSNVLIDAGRDPHLNRVVSFLHGHGISYLDAAVLTHHHGDHYGGYAASQGILERFGVSEFIVPDTTYLFSPMIPAVASKLTAYGIPVTYVRRGDSSDNTPALDWDDTPGFRVEVLAAGLGGLIPDEGSTSGEGMNGNNDSIVMRIEFRGVSFITTGDAEFFAEYSVINAYGRAGTKADVLQIGHHGNNDASSELWLDNVSPRVALISNAMVEAALEKEIVLQGIRAVEADYLVTDRVVPNTPRDAPPCYGHLIAVTDGEVVEIVVEEHSW
ncbi:MAG: MBL fold metallo-hydrolase [Candidatus Eisenbacteria bacterium]|nr:MBL fold metallo-hydrolase [Candidatus Eisenbacteria bacterium]